MKFDSNPNIECCKGRNVFAEWDSVFDRGIYRCKICKMVYRKKSDDCFFKYDESNFEYKGYYKINGEELSKEKQLVLSVFI
ncbi:MAG: hypothetical protein ABIH25_01380 [Candidatus Woesearchaeota archaeon]